MSNTIYIGERVEGVMPNEIFTERPLKLIADLRQKYPLIGLLFVPCEHYGQAMAELKSAGSALSEAMAQVKGR